MYTEITKGVACMEISMFTLPSVRFFGIRLCDEIARLCCYFIAAGSLFYAHGRQRRYVSRAGPHLSHADEKAFSRLPL